MVLKVFSVYDLKACAFLQPFYSPNSGSAIRAFGDAVGEGKSPISAHPEDYQLFEIGSFDDLSGFVVALSPMKMLCFANDFVSAKLVGPNIRSVAGVRVDEAGIPVVSNGGSL